MEGELAGRDTMRRAWVYLQWGLTPIPITPDEKRPFGARWEQVLQSQALSRVKRALSHYDWRRELNLGVVCGKVSGVVVIDVDVRNGAAVHFELAAERHGWPDTFTVRTGGGGYHLYFSLDERAERLYTGASLRVPGIDIRSDGGQVLGPYSVHPRTKQPYLPIRGFRTRAGGPEGSRSAETPLRCEDITPYFRPMPDWLFDALSD